MITNRLIHKGMACMLCMLMASSFSACSLAKEDTTVDAEAETKIDTMIGALVVLEDKNDPEAIVEFDDNNQIVAEKMVDGNDVSYVFKNVGGSAIYDYTVTDLANDENTYTCGSTSGYMQDCSFGVNSQEDVEQVGYDIAGTIYVTDQYKGYLHMYPIYQKEDGTVYIENTQSSAVYVSDGVSQSFTESSAESTNGEENTAETKVKVSIEAVKELKYVVIKEMNQEDQLVKETKYEKDDFEQSLDEFENICATSKKMTLQKDTEYLLIEEHSVDFDEQEVVTRRIYSMDEIEEDGEDAMVTCQFATEDKITFAHDIYVVLP